MHSFYRADVDTVFDEMLKHSPDPTLRADHADIGGIRGSDEPEARFVMLMAARDADDVGIGVDGVAVEHFIEAARFLPGARFLVVGEGSLLEAMKRFANSMGVADRVRFLGRVSEENLPKVYGACDVFVLPSVSSMISTEKPHISPMVASALPTCPAPTINSVAGRSCTSSITW